MPNEIEWTDLNFIEWVVVPLALYLYLFWLRDKFNILHMPLADLAGLIVALDVALALNPDQAARLFDSNSWNGNAGEDSAIWFAMAATGLVYCWFLVHNIEDKIRRITIHHISVGVRDPACRTYLGAIEAYRHRDWRTFSNRWAAGFAIFASYIGMHGALLGLRPISEAFPTFQWIFADLGILVEWAFVVLLAFIGFWAFAFALTAFRVISFSAEPIASTYLPEDKM